jgi:hypothetical protein
MGGSHKFLGLIHTEKCIHGSVFIQIHVTNFCCQSASPNAGVQLVIRILFMVNNQPVS